MCVEFTLRADGVTDERADRQMNFERKQAHTPNFELLRRAALYTKQCNSFDLIDSIKLLLNYFLFFNGNVNGRYGRGRVGVCKLQTIPLGRMASEVT